MFMAYNLQNYLNTIKPKSTGYNLGGSLNSGVVGKVNNAVFGQSKPKVQPTVSKPTVTPSNSSATGTKPPVIQPPTKKSTVTSTLPPTAQPYISSLSSTPKAPVQANPASQTAPVAGQVQPSTAPTPESSPQNAYLKYLTGVFDPKKVDAAKTAQEQAAQRLVDIQNKSERTAFEARKGNNAILDRDGGLKSGAEQASGVYTRRANDDLADLALQETAAARSAQVAQDTFDQYISAGKSVYEAETAAAQAGEKSKQQEFENNLSTQKFEEDKRQFGMQYALDQRKASSSGSGSGGGSTGAPLSALAQAVQNGTISLESLTPTDRARVAAEISSSGLPSTRQQSLQYNLGVVNDLLGNERLGNISGAVQGLTSRLNPKNKEVSKQYKQLKSILSLENRTSLKGQGAISDFEFRILQDAATALDRGLSDEQFKAQLEKVRDVFEGKYALTKATSGQPGQLGQAPQSASSPTDQLLSQYGL